MTIYWNDALKFSVRYVGIFCIFMLSLTAISISDSNANEDIPFVKTSPATEIGIAFYKLAGYEPNFKKWIEGSLAYIRAPKNDKPAILANSIVKLQRKFNEYNPETKGLQIVSRGYIRLIKEDNLEEKNSYQLILKLGEIDEKVEYFPFKIADQWIAIVPENLESELNNYLTKLDYYRVSAICPELKKPGYSKKVRIVFKLNPFMVDATAPILINKNELWLMMVKIDNISVWFERENALIWENQSLSGEYVDKPKSEVKIPGE